MIFFECLDKIKTNCGLTSGTAQCAWNIKQFLRVLFQLMLSEFWVRIVKMVANGQYGQEPLLDCCRNGITSTLYFLSSLNFWYYSAITNGCNRRVSQLELTCKKIFSTRKSHSQKIETYQMVENVFSLASKFQQRCQSKNVSKFVTRRQLALTFIFIHIVCHQHARTLTHTVVDFSFNNNNHNPKFK